MAQRRAQQAGPDLLAAIFQSSTARAVVKGSMAALALQFVELHLDPALLPEPPQPSDEFVTGHISRKFFKAGEQQYCRPGRARRWTRAASLDDLVGQVEHAWRNGKPERLGGLEVDD